MNNSFGMHSITVAACTCILGIATCVSAVPVTFKCNAEGGTPVADLIVDLDARQMKWGRTATYVIHRTDEQYISAHEITPDRVGGEIWVLDRKTGEYNRATVFLGWQTAPA